MAKFMVGLCKALMAASFLVGGACALADQPKPSDNSTPSETAKTPWRVPLMGSLAPKLFARDSGANNGPAPMREVMWNGAWALAAGAGLGVCLRAIYSESVGDVNRAAFDKAAHPFVQGELRLAAKPLLTVKPLSGAAWAAIIFATFELTQRTLRYSEDFHDACQRNPRCKNSSDAVFAWLGKLHADWKGE